MFGNFSPLVLIATVNNIMLLQECIILIRIFLWFYAFLDEKSGTKRVQGCSVARTLMWEAEDQGEGELLTRCPCQGVCGFPLVFLAPNFSRSWFCPDVEQNELQNKILGF